MDIKTIRLALVREFEGRDWTQELLASRSGIRQSHVSKILRVGDDPDELKDLAARVLFQIISQGFGLKLSSFFQHIEAVQEGTKSADEPLPSAEQVTHAAALASPIGLAPFEAFGNALGRSIVDHLDRRDREREDSPGPRKKPKRRKDTRSHARRRV